MKSGKQGTGLTFLSVDILCKKGSFTKSSFPHEKLCHTPSAAAVVMRAKGGILLWLITIDTITVYCIAKMHWKPVL